jgi:hypothetical protein
MHPSGSAIIVGKSSTLILEPKREIFQGLKKVPPLPSFLNWGAKNFFTYKELTRINNFLSQYGL